MGSSAQMFRVSEHLDTYAESALLEQRRVLARKDLRAAAVDNDLLVWVDDALVLGMREDLEDLVPGFGFEDGHAPEGPAARRGTHRFSEVLAKLVVDVELHRLSSEGRDAERRRASLTCSYFVKFFLAMSSDMNFLPCSCSQYFLKCALEMPGAGQKRAVKRTRLGVSLKAER